MSLFFFSFTYCLFTCFTIPSHICFFFVANGFTVVLVAKLFVRSGFIYWHDKHGFGFYFACLTMHVVVFFSLSLHHLELFFHILPLLLIRLTLGAFFDFVVCYLFSYCNCFDVPFYLASCEVSCGSRKERS